MQRLIINIIGFNIGWTACVLSGAKGVPWVAALMVACIVGAQIATAARPRADLLAILAVVAIGVPSDALLRVTGVLTPAAGVLDWPVFLLWDATFWTNFAATLAVSFRWLEGRALLAVAMGAVGGPFAYWMGSRLGALSLGEPTWQSLLWLALAWSILMPLTLAVALRAQRLAATPDRKDIQPHAA